MLLFKNCVFKFVKGGVHIKKTINQLFILFIYSLVLSLNETLFFIKSNTVFLLSVSSLILLMKIYLILYF